MWTAEAMTSIAAFSQSTQLEDVPVDEVKWARSRQARVTCR
jgi:hypothetical protein